MLEPEQLLQAHLQPFLSEQTVALQSRLESTQVANKQLADEVTAQRAEIDSLLSGLEGVIGDLENASNVLHGKESDGLPEILKG